MELLFIFVVSMGTSILIQNVAKRLFQKVISDPFNLGLIVGTLQAVITGIIAITMVNLIL